MPVIYDSLWKFTIDKVLDFRTWKEVFLSWFETDMKVAARLRGASAWQLSKIIIKIFYNNSTFHVLLLNRAKSVRVSIIQLLNHISPGLREGNAVLKKWWNISFLWHCDITSNPLHASRILEICINKDEDRVHRYCSLKILLNFEQKPTEK